jgi:hypothetical protein
MSFLVIGSNEKRAIRNAIVKARAKPTPWEALKAVADESSTPTVLLRDRKPGVAAARRDYQSQNVMLGTYRAALSFEYQPAGLMRHLSVSSQAAGMVPGPEVMQMICEAYGFSGMLCKAIGSPRATVYAPTRPFRVWVEEFEPGRMAINVIELEP